MTAEYPTVYPLALTAAQREAIATYLRGWPPVGLLCGGWLHRLLSGDDLGGCDVDLALSEDDMSKVHASFPAAFALGEGSAPNSIRTTLPSGAAVDAFSAGGAHPEKRVLGFDFDCLHAFVRLPDPSCAWLTEAAYIAIASRCATAVQPVLQRRIDKLRARGIAVTHGEVLPDDAPWDSRMIRKVESWQVGDPAPWEGA